MEIGAVRSHSTKSLRQHVEALLDVDPSEEQQNELAFELGVFLFDHRSGRQIVAEGEIDAIRDETDWRPRCELSQVADFGPRQRVKARGPSQVTGFDQCQVDSLLPALVFQCPRFGHAVSGDQVRHMRPPCGSSPAPRVCLPEPVQMYDLSPADRFLEVGLRPLDRHTRGLGRVLQCDGVGVTIKTSRRIRLSADVIPRMLGTMPPSRTGSNPLQRCSQPIPCSEALSPRFRAFVTHVISSRVCIIVSSFVGCEPG